MTKVNVVHSGSWVRLVLNASQQRGRPIPESLPEEERKRINDGLMLKRCGRAVFLNKAALEVGIPECDISGLISRGSAQYPLVHDSHL